MKGVTSGPSFPGRGFREPGEWGPIHSDYMFYIRGPNQGILKSHQ